MNGIASDNEDFMVDESVKRLSVTSQWSQESDLIIVILFLSQHDTTFFT